MRHTLSMAVSAIALAVSSAFSTAALADRDDRDAHERWRGQPKTHRGLTLGPRPFYLVEAMSEGRLKRRLLQCKDEQVRRTDFSIAHRGAPLQFPEHTKESYEAGARMGAGIVECDVTFTRDGHLVCRHAQNDLHTTTNILLTSLASTCIEPFTPAKLDANGNVITPASAQCRASELSLREFKSLRGKMDSFDPAARSVEEYVGGTASWRTDLYAGRGTLLTFRESIELNERLGVKHTPELKAGDSASVSQVFGGQEQYAQRLIEELEAADVRPRDVWPQSFNVNDVLYWIGNSRYGRQAVFLVDYDAAADSILLFDRAGKRLEKREDQLSFFAELRKAKVRIIAPAMPALLALEGGRVVPSQLAKDLKAMGFEIVTWTFERADLRQGAAKAGFYYDFDPSGEAIKTDGDMYNVLDVLAREVGIAGIFSDWPATVTYYANCMKLE